MKKHLYLILDTETANTFTDGKDLDTSSALVYDLGLAVIDRHGHIYEKYSLVNADVFFMDYIMNTAYYANKIPQYYDGLANGTRKVSDTFKMYYLIKDLCEKYDIKAVVAHNARFDVQVLNSTIRYFSKSKIRYFLPYGLPIYDTLKMSRQVLGKTKKYSQFCKDNGYIAKNKQNRLTAEIIYRYLTGNNDFVENHTGFEDVEIEKEIFAHCMKSHKKIDRVLW